MSNNKKFKCVCLLSGGLDSTATLFYSLKKFDRQVLALHLSYGQRAEQQEYDSAIRVCKSLGVELYRVKLSNYNNLKLGLTNPSLDMSDESPNFEGLPASFTPFRNLLFLTQAAIVGEAFCSHPFYISIGATQVDYSGYPDCKADFFESAEHTLNLAIGAKTHKIVSLYLPILNVPRPDYLKDIRAKDMGVFELLKSTYSCYEKEECGKCPSCLLRKQAWKGVGA